MSWFGVFSFISTIITRWGRWWLAMLGKFSDYLDRWRFAVSSTGLLSLPSTPRLTSILSDCSNIYKRGPRVPTNCIPCYTFSTSLLYVYLWVEYWQTPNYLCLIFSSLFLLASFSWNQSRGDDLLSWINWGMCWCQWNSTTWGFGQCYIRSRASANITSSYDIHYRGCMFLLVIFKK